MLKNPKNGRKFRVKFVVVNDDLTPKLGKATSENMGLITIDYDNFESVSKVAENTDLLSEYSDVFVEG